MRTRIIDEGVGLGRIAWRSPTTAVPARLQSGEDTARPEQQELARLQARLAEVESAVETSTREAYHAGLTAGTAAGKAQLEAEVHDSLERLAQAIGELAETRKRMFEETESDLVKLSMEIARRILRRELTIDPDAVEALVKGALDKLEGQMVYKVRVHPDHEQIVRTYMQQLGSGGQVQIVGDSSRERGTVIFELDSGNLDASLETQLREIERGLTDGNTR